MASPNGVSSPHNETLNLSKIKCYSKSEEGLAQIYLNILHLL